MNPATQTVTFSGSRLKLVPQAIVLLAFILPLGFLWFGISFEVARLGFSTPGRHVGFAFVLTTVVGFLIWSELHTLRRIARPDLLTVASTGFGLISGGRRQYHAWAKSGAPEMRQLSGKSVARSIVVPLSSGGRVVILAEEYANRAEDVLKALEQAKAGLPIDPPQRSSEALYRYVAIPASTLVLGIVLAGLGAILFN
jgi:hypothetical protein